MDTVFFRFRITTVCISVPKGRAIGVPGVIHIIVEIVTLFDGKEMIVFFNPPLLFHFMKQTLFKFPINMRRTRMVLVQLL